jgi:hypothetical protein
VGFSTRWRAGGRLGMLVVAIEARLAARARLPTPVVILLHG